MTPDALTSLSHSLPRSPGLRVLLDDWAHVLDVGGAGVRLDLAAAAHAALAGAHRLAALVPEDDAHREAVGVLQEVANSFA